MIRLALMMITLTMCGIVRFFVYLSEGSVR
jgi:hypothetical protein